MLWGLSQSVQKGTTPTGRFLRPLKDKKVHRPNEKKDSVCVWVCVCVRERERERGTVEGTVASRERREGNAEKD